MKCSSKFRGRSVFYEGPNVFYEGPKCLLLGAEVSFQEGPRCLDEGPKGIFLKGPKCPKLLLSLQFRGAPHLLTSYEFIVGEHEFMLRFCASAVMRCK